MNTSTDGAFPKFPDGDVHFVLAPGKDYQLHTNTLKMYSTRLDEMLNARDAAKLTPDARRKGATCVFRVELMLPDECDAKAVPPSMYHVEVGGLRLRRLNDKGRPTGTGTTDLSASFEAGLFANRIHQHWNNVLRAIYQQPIQFDPFGTDPETGDVDLAALIDDITGICDVAHYLGCMRVVTHQIDNALIKQGQTLWIAIAASPWRWAELGLRVRSELVFREAVCHLVGRWPRLTYQASRMDYMYPGGDKTLEDDLRYVSRLGFPDPRGLTNIVDDERERRDLEVSAEDAQRAHDIISGLSPETRTLVQRKVAEVEHLKRATNMRLMGYYPTFFARAGTQHTMAPRTKTVGEAIQHLQSQLQTASGRALPGVVFGENSSAAARLPGESVGPGSTTIRNTGQTTRTHAYTKDILGWMAVTLFRHWFGQFIVRITSGHPQLDGGYGIYKALADGGEAFLGHAGVEGFTQWFPLSAKSRRDFEGVLTRIKEELKTYVEDLMKNRLTLDAEKAGQVMQKVKGGVASLFGKATGVKLHKGRLVLQYLVCADVHVPELPWKLESRARKEQHMQHPFSAGEKGISSGVSTVTDAAQRVMRADRLDMRSSNQPSSPTAKKSSAGLNKRIRWEDEAEDEDDMAEEDMPPRKRRNAISFAADPRAPRRAIGEADDDEDIAVSDEAIEAAYQTRRAMDNRCEDKEMEEAEEGNITPEQEDSDEQDSDSPLFVAS